MKRDILLALVLSCQLVTATASAQEAPAESPNWWTTGYLVDYGLIAGGAAAYLIAGKLGPNDTALFGPRFDADNPTAIFSPEYSDRIGRLHAEEGAGETVPVKHAIIITAGAGAVLIAEEALTMFLSRDGSPQVFHDVVVGFVEATALTAGTTEISKVLVGRLRPDFQDRAARHLCNTEPPEGFDCTAYAGRPLSSDADEAEHIFEDGRKSFWSGHSSFAFSTFTYLTFAAGGRYVWGANATPATRAVGLVLQTSFMATAAFIAGSRLDDGRHHVTDVLVGSVVGAGIASFSYWRRFDGDGLPVRRASTLSLDPGPAAGLTLTWTP